MLLFIKVKRGNLRHECLISIQLLLLFITISTEDGRFRKNFNTTLVTVYPVSWLSCLLYMSFQYNSCYCLSKSDQEEYKVGEFQYNSCYCLSNTFKPFFFFIIVSFSDKINVSLYFSQPPSIFSHFSPMWPQMAISRGLLTLIDFIGWEISKIFWQIFRLAVPKT